MGEGSSKPKFGDVIESNFNIFNGSGTEKKQYAVVVGDNKVITKDEHGLKCEELNSKTWSKSTIIEKAGKNCANHALKRFEKGKFINEIRRKDIKAFNHITANSQHFVHDCINQMDPEEDPQEMKNGGSGNLAWLGIGGLALGAAGLIFASHMNSSDRKSTNGGTTDSKLKMR